MNDRFTEKASSAITRSAKIAGSMGHTYVGSEHLLLSLIESESSVTQQLLKKYGVNAEDFRRMIGEYSGTGVESRVGPSDMTPRCRRILERSHLYATKYGAKLIGTEHILCALLDERDCIATRLLKNRGVNVLALRDEMQSLLKSRAADAGQSGDKGALKQYGKDFTEMAQKGHFDPVVGRERETERLIRVLCRKNKNNPCLIGEAGVGKSAIVEGLAMRIAEGRVPNSLKGASVISVDLTSMVAGAKYRGDFEERIKNIVAEAARNKSIILFIDEIHTIVGAGAAEGAIDASNILKPQLSRGELQIIGATTFSEYRRYIEKDPALERRFQPITVEEPTEDEAIKMLLGIKERYETHHGVMISNDVVGACVSLSVRYINDRFLPDKAIDIMDEACACAASKRHSNGFNSSFIYENARQNYSGVEAAVRVGDFETALMISSSQAPDVASEAFSAPPNVTLEDVRLVVSEMSGVDISDVQSGVDFEQIEHNLRRKIIGQNDAIRKIVHALKRSHSGLSSTERPRGTFLFLGESGIGKTALAQAMAEELFKNGNAFMRFDMSEYSEKHSVSKLIGAPPGYAGYDSGGALTEAVRKRPHSLILFDEIEKADREVQNLFLQIADNGYLTDSSGRRVSFRNTVVAMTSNASRGIGSKMRVGFGGAEKDNDEIGRLFSSEFLGRFDEIIHFSPLDDETLREIALRRLGEIRKILSDKGILFDYEDIALYAVVERSHDRKTGARSVLRYIATNIEGAISDALISREELKSITLCLDDDGTPRIRCETAAGERSELML